MIFILTLDYSNRDVKQSIESNITFELNTQFLIFTFFFFSKPYKHHLLMQNQQNQHLKTQATIISL